MRLFLETGSVPGMSKGMIFHICTRDAWAEAQRSGVYDGSADDARDGFIHFSGPGQVAESAARHRAGQSGLMLIGVEAEALGDALKWEPSRGGELFPHLYGGFSPKLAARVEDLPLGGDGRHLFPADLIR